MLLFTTEPTSASELAVEILTVIESCVCHETYFKTMLNKEEK